MKITEIYYLERLNLGNYQHSELSATAILADGENATLAIEQLKKAVHEGLNGIIANVGKGIQDADSNIGKDISSGKVDAEISLPPKSSGTPKTDKKPRKEKVEEPKSEVEAANIPPVIPEVVKEEKPKASKVVKYDSNVPEHKSLFGGFLQKKYDTKWKTVAPAEEIKAFTSSLNGQDFLDDKGQIVPSFVEQVLTFFGA